MVRRLGVLVLGVGLSVVGCRPKDRAQTVDEGARHAALEARVLAKVGERTITVGDFLEALTSLDPIDRARFESPARRKELLDALIETEALAQEARAQGLDKDPAVAEELRMALRDAMLREIRATVPAPEGLEASEVRAYYDAHLASYAEPERRRLQAIVVSSEADGRKIVAHLGPSPTALAFGQAVRAKSVDPSAKTGAPLDLLGDVGFASAPGDDRGNNARIPQEVRVAAHALAGVGAVSGVVPLGSTFWIVRVAAISKARARSFEEVERTIRIQLAQEKRHAAEKAKLVELAREANVKVDDRALEAALEARDRLSDAGPPT